MNHADHIFRSAAECAELCRAAYDSTDAAPHEAVRSWPEWRHWRRDNAQGLVCWNDEHVVAAIAGTNDLADGLDDIRVASETVAIRGLEYEVHRGFLAHARKVVEALRETPVPWGERRIWLTGHSLGGAVAAILPLLVAELRAHAVIAFGPPMFITARTAGRYDVPLWVFAHRDDVIPDVPKCTLPPADLLRAGRVLEWLAALRSITWYGRTGSWRYVHGAGEVRAGRSPIARIARALRLVWSLGSLGPLSASRAAWHNIRTYNRDLGPFLRLAAGGGS